MSEKVPLADIGASSFGRRPATPTSIPVSNKQNLHPRQLTLSVGDLATANLVRYFAGYSFSRLWLRSRSERWSLTLLAESSNLVSRHSGFQADVRQSPKYDEQSQDAADQTVPRLTTLAPLEITSPGDVGSLWDEGPAYDLSR
jgi:hypothetical protein